MIIVPTTHFHDIDSPKDPTKNVEQKMNLCLEISVFTLKLDSLPPLGNAWALKITLDKKTLISSIGLIVQYETVWQQQVQCHDLEQCECEL